MSLRKCDAGLADNLGPQVFDRGDQTHIQGPHALLEIVVLHPTGHYHRPDTFYLKINQVICFNKHCIEIWKHLSLNIATEEQKVHLCMNF